jgi:hypothetical protein
MMTGTAQPPRLSLSLGLLLLLGALLPRIALAAEMAPAGFVANFHSRPCAVCSPSMTNSASWGSETVAYLGAADNVSRLLPIPLRRTNEPVKY